MRKEKFVYNTHTLRYEKVVISLKERIVKLFGFFSVAMVTSFLLLYVLYSVFPSPREKVHINEITELKNVIKAQGKQLDLMSNVLENIQDRDASVHRMILGMDPMDKGIWEGGVGGHEKYNDLLKYRNSYELLVSTREKIEKLSRQMVVESKSLDTIQRIAGEREKRFASIPSIKPVRGDKLNRNITLLSGFGWRLHPIYKIMKFHKGLDFSAPEGTPIQATGDGRVVKVERSGRGYGNSVVISHGYGYETLYGHMKRVDVKEGQVIKKGQHIGLVGDTGTSTAPHCHYEVHKNGREVNPIDFVMDGLSPIEYQALVKMADSANQSAD